MRVVPAKRGTRNEKPKRLGSAPARPRCNLSLAIHPRSAIIPAKRSQKRMNIFNLFFQWLFWSVGVAGLGLGIAIAMRGQVTQGIVASMICFGTMVPLGNAFKSRRELARLNGVSSNLR